MYWEMLREEFNPITKKREEDLVSEEYKGFAWSCQLPDFKTIDNLWKILKLSPSKGPS